ncbi:MAG: carboxypeptidase-like regulatory domain-containing protein, partial [Tannerella sp.]|nr:carboxypeptidase-like regulatory domain-containing protein [Tannerella sp.]
MKLVKKKMQVKNKSNPKKLPKYAGIILMLICFNVVNIMAMPSYSQATRLSLNLSNVSIRDAFKEIEKNSEYVFIYSEKVYKDLNAKVSINANQEKIDRIMEEILKESNLSYTLNDRQVIVNRKAVESTLLVQQQQSKVKGRVIDKSGEALPGVTVQIVGSTRGAITDENGNFEMDNIAVGTKLSASFIGMQPKEFIFQGKGELIIVLEENVNELDEVTIVAFGKQKKESVVSSITTVNSKDLQIASSNLTASFAGKIPGLISFQTTGEPGADNAQFFVRGVTSFGYKSDPLILIDGFEASTDDLARLQPDDIEAFSILKDAAATVLYGARGANGIISITTKTGQAGSKVKISARLDVNVATPTSMLELLDGVSYMRLYNDARLSRHNDQMLQFENEPSLITPMTAWYSEEKIQATMRGDNPML